MEQTSGLQDDRRGPWRRRLLAICLWTTAAIMAPAISALCVFAFHTNVPTACVPLVALLLFAWIRATASPEEFLPDEVRARTPMTDPEYFDRFYASFGAQPEIVWTIRHTFTRIFGRAALKFYPTDNPVVWFDVDASDVIARAQRDLGMRLSQEERAMIDGSCHSFVEAFHHVSMNRS